LDKKIAVLGTGANGSSTSANLIQAGYDVVMIDQWAAHVEAIRENGLLIKMPDEELHVHPRAYHLSDVCTLNEKYDIVFLMAKAYDTRWLCEFIKPYLQEDGILVGIQNAMTVDDISEILGPSRTLGCVIEMSSEIFTPGIVQRNNPPAHTWFGIGSIDPSTADRVAEIEEILRNAGKVTVSDDIMSAKWMKLVVNTMCLGPLAMLGITLYEAQNVPGVRDFVSRVGTEALTAGQELGYTLQPIFGLSEDDVKDTNNLLGKLLDKLLEDVGPSARDCVLQDHLKGRYSEVDMINGLVVEAFERRGIDARANAVVAEITRKIQLGELKPELANLELAQQMLAS
jgi:2-dehydropantoate 2-reductase